jgi:hypothetical protein
MTCGLKCGAGAYYPEGNVLVPPGHAEEEKVRPEDAGSHIRKLE